MKKINSQRFEEKKNSKTKKKNNAIRYRFEL